ncbi:hypothetical protein LP420_39335 [Massilia sp. B-10]|nr:hypothetical protein LP420_39335 [Massilia sp. B-10]
MKLPGWFRRLPLPTPLKHVAGSAWMMAYRLFALGSIAAFGLAVFVGALSAIDSVFEGRDQWYAQGHLADLELRVVADDAANFPASTIFRVWLSARAWCIPLRWRPRKTRPCACCWSLP